MEFSYEQYGCGLQSEIRIFNGSAVTITLVLTEKLRGDWPSDFELDTPFRAKPDAYIVAHSRPTPKELIEG